VALLSVFGYYIWKAKQERDEFKPDKQARSAGLHAAGEL
jgi:hypothetical protein